ncbi:MAG: NAD-dependent epimerase/dehydratase family protein [Planctomycetes bacterium]|nr:NAD-dependent epimerase/dehydratase family protein [Planctomycetota bacterium]
MVSKNYDTFFDGQRVLVTGGAGFIGSHLTQHLASLGASVHVLDDFSSGHSSNLEGIDAQVTEGSILDVAAIKKAMQGCSIVFHEAAFVSVPSSFQQADKCFEINIKGTSNILSLAAKANCDRVVFASSAACYGSQPSVPSRESDPAAAESPYAQSKLMGEQLMRDASIDTVSLRYFNVFGQRQDPKSQYAAVVSSFAQALNTDQIPTIYGDGKQSRDFTNVANIVHANLLAASYGKPIKGEVFNVGTGAMMSLIALLQSMTGTKDCKINFQPPRAGDVPQSCASIEKITSYLKYAPIADTSSSLTELINPKPH